MIQKKERLYTTLSYCKILIIVQYRGIFVGKENWNYTREDITILINDKTSTYSSLLEKCHYTTLHISNIIRSLHVTEQS